MRDIYEERHERVEKFQMATDKLQTALVGRLRLNIDNGIDKSLNYANKQIGNMKNQCISMFDELDKLITQKYSELQACANDIKRKEVELEHNREILAWIEHNQEKINNLLEI